MRLVVLEFMTLDGVMEAPGFESHRAGRNGWAMQVSDEALQAANGAEVYSADALLFGRRTFAIWAAFWPTAPDVARAMGERITAMPKYVVSKTLPQPAWANTEVLRGDLGEEIRRLKELPGGDLKVYGSADLVQGLLQHDLVDEIRLIVFPVLLGSGKRLFGEEADHRNLRLLEMRTFDSGVVMLRYDMHGVPIASEAELEPYRWTDEHTRSFLAADDAERVLATVLFTDIVDSTGQAARLGDRAWKQLLDRHDEAAAAEVRRFNGELVKATGDGILARFDAPTRAVRCAFGLRAALRRLDIDTRVAIHTGEVEIRDRDIGGIGVHIASRVLGETGAGQVVVTRTVRDLVIGTDLAFAPLGSVALRGVPGQWELFAASQR